MTLTLPLPLALLTRAAVSPCAGSFPFVITSTTCSRTATGITSRLTVFVASPASLARSADIPFSAQHMIAYAVARGSDCVPNVRGVGEATTLEVIRSLHQWQRQHGNAATLKDLLHSYLSTLQTDGFVGQLASRETAPANALACKDWLQLLAYSAHAFVGTVGDAFHGRVLLGSLPIVRATATSTTSSGYCASVPLALAN